MKAISFSSSNLHVVLKCVRQNFEMILTRAKLLTGKLPLAQTVQVMGTLGAFFWNRVPANAKQTALVEHCFADITTLGVTTREFSQNICVSQQSYFGRNLYCGPSLILGVELTLQ